MLRFSRIFSFSRSRGAWLAAGAFALGLAGGGLIVAAFQEPRIAPAELALGKDRGAPAAPSDERWRAPGRYTVEVVRVIDGDTFEARVQVWPGLELTTRVRLRGIDAPEMKARCADERARAEAALAALRTMLAGREVTIWGVALDKYGGRIVAGASTWATPDVSAALLARENCHL